MPDYEGHELTFKITDTITKLRFLGFIARRPVSADHLSSSYYYLCESLKGFFTDEEFIQFKLEVLEPIFERHLKNLES